MPVDIAILTIRDDEFRAVFDRLEDYQLDEPIKGESGRTYSAFSVPMSGGVSCQVALKQCVEQGNDVAQMIASDMMRDLDPQLVLVSGIAGGVPHSDFTLGDVILSSRIYNFNVNSINQQKMTFNVSGGIHPRASEIITNIQSYKKRLTGWNESGKLGLARPFLDVAQCSLYGDEDWRKKVHDSLITQFGTSTNANRLPLYKAGSIASSNSLMKNTEIPTIWLEDARSILAIEMEAGGIFQASQQVSVQYPVIAIRGISDIIGLKRDERWLSYACQTAGAFTCSFIQAGIITPRVGEQPAHSAPISPMPSLPSPQKKKTTPPFDVFISYSQDDEEYKVELEKHLVMLKRNGLIRPWNSQQAGAGLERKEVISNLINNAEIVLLLISNSFLASDDLYEQELRHAMERHASNQARVIPILIRQADISDTPFHHLQRLPRDGKPVVPGGNLDEKLARIALEIKQICEQLRDGQKGC